MMDFPIVQAQDANVVSDQLSTLEGMESSPHLEHQPPMFDLEFPSFVHGTSRNKRLTHPSSAFPSFKRRNTATSVIDDQAAVPNAEENCWTDSLLESWNPEEESFETFSLGSCTINPQDMDNASGMIKEPISVSIEEAITADTPRRISFPAIQGGGHAESRQYGYRNSQLEADTLQQDQFHNIPAQLKCDRSILEPATAAVSPFLNSSQPRGGSRQVAPQIETPQPQIPSLFSSTEPMLLTLTSYPFRIIYSNEAFSNLKGRKRSVIGDSVFDVFVVEGRVLRPCLATYPTLLGRLENHVALVSSPLAVDEHQGNRCIRCGIQAYPVTKRNDGNALRYFAVRFTPLDKPLTLR